MANGDPLRAGQGVDAQDTTTLDARPFPGIGAGLLVRNYVFRIGAPTIPVELPDLEVAAPVPVRTAKVPVPAALARIKVKARTESALGRTLATPEAIATRKRRS